MVGRKKELYQVLVHLRLQFLIGILIPLIVGTLAAVSISKVFYVWEFVLVVIMGLGLHLATNVYNDVYDTMQGADKTGDDTRNFFSGGSGVLLENPGLLPRFVFVARFGLVVSFVAMVGLLFFVDVGFWLFFVAIYAVSALLSKYYTAAPLKLGYHGFGEILIWFSFGPMAVFLAGLSQHIVFNWVLVALMPVTGLCTVTIVWIGQFIDIFDDRAAGKRGMVIRLGTKKAVVGYAIIQFLLIINVVIVCLWAFRPWFFVLLSLIPYVVLIPLIMKRLIVYRNNPVELRMVGKWNAALYGLFSLLFICGIAGTMIF